MVNTVKRKSSQSALQTGSPYLSVDERTAKGRSLRDTAPRASHAGWKPVKNRHDPVELLSLSNVGRLEELIPIRFGRMSESPFAFFRGSAALMAADLANTPTSGLRVQACGDAHLMNFDPSVVTGARNYRSTGTGHGNCTLSCHGKEHTATSY